MLETVVIKPSIKQQFDKFMQDGRILFYSEKSSSRTLTRCPGRIYSV